MVQHVSLREPLTAIKAIENDGGVVLTDFATVDDVEKVNADAAPHLRADAVVHASHSARVPRLLILMFASRMERGSNRP